MTKFKIVLEPIEPWPEPIRCDICGAEMPSWYSREYSPISWCHKCSPPRVPYPRFKRIDENFWIESRKLGEPLAAVCSILYQLEKEIERQKA